MKKTISTLFLTLFALQITMAQTERNTAANADKENSEIQKLLKSYEKKIYFTQNQGQFNPEALYRADFPLGQAVVTRQGIVVTTYDPAMMNARQEEGEQVEQDIKNGKPWHPISGRMKGHSWRMDFMNSSPSMTIEAKEHHSDAYNYFRGDVKLNSVNNFGEIWYNNVYDNVDVRYYPSAEGTLEYDIVCKPGFRSGDIKIKFDGISKITVAENGHLVLHTTVGNVDLPAPVAYQKSEGIEKSVKANYKVSGNEVSFHVSDFDATQPLIIDPIALRWATWVNTNSSGDNHGHCIWVDQSDGAIYVVARVVGTTDQITVGAFDVSANGNLETIVGKYLEPAAIGGSGTRVWQTYIGGSADENPYAMEQGPDGNLYITGYTSSPDFPLIGGTAFTGGGASIDDRAQTTDNIFIMKITKDGQSIKSSVIGGDGDDGSFDLRINTNGDIVICGNTQSANLLTLFPGSGATNANNGNIDGIVFKINSDLSAVSWIKNYGGSGIDQPTIMVQNNSNGEIFVGGYTTSTNFPTTNPRQSTLGGTQSGFLQKLNSSGTTLWSSYFQSGSGTATAILCMEYNTTKNQLYFGGITGGLPTSNVGHVGVYDSTYNAGTNDFFVCRMDTNQNFVAGTYIGGSANEVNMMGLNTDLNNDVYVFGYTNSTNFPVTALPNTPLQTTNLGLNDKVFLKLSSTLSTLNFSTYYGGAADDYDPVGERGIKFSNCRIYTIVTSKSNNIPLTVGALNTSRISTTPYEPGLVVWANPPDLVNNTINDDQTICAGATPQDIIGSVPNYSLPTIIRNGTTSTYPALASAATYQWQTSTDSVNWSNMSGQTAQNLSGAAIGPLFVKTFFRRIIGGDACILAGAADQVVTVKIITVTGIVNNVNCNSTGNGSITANSDGVAPFGYVWSNGQTTQTATNLTTGTYTVTVTDAGNCTASASFNITVNPSPTVSISGNNTVCSGQAITLNAGPGYAGYNWSTGATTQTISVNTAATFTVTVTAANGCTASASATTSTNSNPTPSITGTLSFCSGSSTQICATAGLASYVWSTGATTQCITVSTANTFTVTVTNANGCTGSTSATTTVNANPAPSISGTLAFCSGSSSQICASAGLASYVWNTGATTQCIVVSTANTFTVSVSDANGCTGSTSAITTVNPNPNCSITGSGSICQGSSTQWCAATNSNYSWSTGATTQCITVATAGTFTVTVTNSSGCSSSCSKTLTVNPNPTPSITGTLTFCQGSSTQMCATVGLASYVWSTGATTQCITVSTANTFTVTVTNANGCTGSTSATTIVNANPAPSISGTLAFCQGSSTQICASAGLASYVWSTGATTQCIVTGTANTFTVSVSDANGCTGSASATTTVNPNPICSITGNSSICQGSSTQWCAATNSNYSWSTGATTQCITVATAGIFTVTVTNSSGCSSSCSKTLTVNPNPTPSITGTLSFCQGSSTQICATAGLASYIWSTGATTQCITVSTANTFTVTVTNANGCSGSTSATTTVNANPAPSISGTLAFCSGSSSQICASAGLASYVWNTGATTQCIVVSTANTFTVSVSDANGCTGSTSATTTVNPNPNCSITGSGSICQGSSTQWCAATNSNYSWSTGATTQCITVATAGTFTVTVTNSSGCSSSCSKTLTVNPNPTPSITGTLSFCQGSSTQICATAGLASYVWSTGATTQCITVSTANTFTVTVTNANGCTGSTSATTTVNPLPSSAISGNSSVCSGGSTQWCAPTGLPGYLWNTGATTQCITVSTATTFTVTVTDANGCTSSSSKSLTVNQVANCSITGNSAVCSGNSTQWCAAAGLATYNWSTGATTQCITLSTAGTYTVTTTDGNGCISNCNKALTVNALPSCLITGNSSVCSGNSAQWCAPAGLTAYLWSTGATTQCITLNTAGTYTVTTTNENGCTSSCNKALTVRALPSCLVTGTAAVCPGSSTQWCAPAGLAAYLWSTGATTQCVTVSSAGTYTVTTTNTFGCTSSCNKALTIKGIPSCLITGNTSICPGSSTQWCAPAGLAAYLWSTGATTQCITINAAGTYTVTTTNTGGCTSSCNKALTIKTIPGCNITGSSSICTGNSAQWCAPAGLAAYLWSTGATTQCITVNSAGTYTVTTTNTGGCTSSCNKTLTVNALPGCLITGNNSVCTGNSTQWCAPAGLSAYLWSTGATTQCITLSTAGTYTVTTTATGGCTSSCNKSLTVNSLPGCLITGNGSICSGFSTQWCAPAGLASYLWSTGATTQCVTLNTAGTYTVTTTNGNGCTSSCNKSLVVNTNNVTITANGPTTYCELDYQPNLTLCASVGVNYIWDTGNTSQCVPADLKTHLFVVTVTDANGCVGTASQQVVENEEPDAAINAPSSLPICGLTGNALTETSTPGSLFGWSVTSSDNSWVINSGATTSSISYKAGSAGVCGIFSLTATDPATGCKTTVTSMVCSKCEEHCSYDQSFYGSVNGLSCDGLSKTQLITNLLSTTLVNGAATRTVSILSSEVSCVIDKLPSKTTASALPVGNVTCATATGAAYLSTGQFIHSLLGEAIALGLNVRLDPSLVNLVLSGPYMTTYKASDCSGGKAVGGTKLVYAFPQSVLNYLGSNKTVGNLLLLANQALGATYVQSGSNPTISEIDSAVKAINYGFDKCRILAGFGTSSSGVRIQDQQQLLETENALQVNAYPNPFNSTATIEFVSADKAAHTTVDIYSLSGSKVASLFESDIEAGTVYKAEFDAKDLGEGIYIYRIISGDNIINGKLILIK